MKKIMVLIFSFLFIVGGLSASQVNKDFIMNPNNEIKVYNYDAMSSEEIKSHMLSTFEQQGTVGIDRCTITFGKNLIRELSPDTTEQEKLDYLIFLGKDIAFINESNEINNYVRTEHVELVNSLAKKYKRPSISISLPNDQIDRRCALFTNYLLKKNNKKDIDDYQKKKIEIQKAGTSMKLDIFEAKIKENFAPQKKKNSVVAKKKKRRRGGKNNSGNKQEQNLSQKESESDTIMFASDVIVVDNPVETFVNDNAVIQEPIQGIIEQKKKKQSRIKDTRRKTMSVLPNNKNIVDEIELEIESVGNLQEDTIDFDVESDTKKTITRKDSLKDIIVQLNSMPKHENVKDVMKKERRASASDLLATKQKRRKSGIDAVKNLKSNTKYRKLKKVFNDLDVTTDSTKAGSRVKLTTPDGAETTFHTKSGKKGIGKGRRKSFRKSLNPNDVENDNQ